MNIVKLTVGPGPVYPVSPSVFEAAALKRPPYYQNKGTPMFYAVCPRCDNPVEIVGLYKRAKPYARHHTHDIPGLAQYSQEAYDFCPYANPQKPDSSARKKVKSGLPLQILKLLRDQFDRVIYLLSKDTGIVFSERLAEQMLDRYLAGEGYLYPWATMGNLPWIFGHLSHRWNLWGRVVRKDSPLYAALAAHKDLQFNDQGQLRTKPGKFVDINFLFMQHRLVTKNTEKDREYAGGNLEETLEFVVTEGNGNRPKTLFKTVLHIDQAYFQNLVDLPDDKAQRNQKLLAIAQAKIKA